MTVLVDCRSPDHISMENIFPVAEAYSSPCSRHRKITCNGASEVTLSLWCRFQHHQRCAVRLCNNYHQSFHGPSADIVHVQFSLMPFHNTLPNAHVCYVPIEFHALPHPLQLVDPKHTKQKPVDLKVKISQSTSEKS